MALSKALSTPPVILTVAGFDPTSGAGATADLKTIASLGCYGVACLTGLTIQNTQGVSRVEPVAADIVEQTLARLAEDMTFSAIKIGMVGNSEVATVIAEFLENHRDTWVVLDPVMMSSSGVRLTNDPGLGVVKQSLVPAASLVTPNLAEAEVLAGFPVRDLADMKRAAQALRDMGAKNVVVTGGHLEQACDYLLMESSEEEIFSAAKIDSNSTHGTGCAFSTAIACNLAIGMNMLQSVLTAKQYVRQAILNAYPVGKGKGPLHHFFKQQKVKRP